jgi:prepilin-type N-terminal cleavage/methylation domain-containing protein
MSSNSRNKKLPAPKVGDSGFTLLEVLISITLLVMIGLSIYQATTETYRLRDVLMHEGDFYNGIRLSMGVVDRDITQLYSPTVLVRTQGAGGAGPSAAETREMQELLNSDLGRSTEFWNGVVDTNGIRPSRFQGDEQKLSFVTASHIRTYRDRPESELQKVSYSLENDRSPLAEAGAKVLVRSTRTNVFTDEVSRDDKKSIYPLLRGISRIKWRYFDREKNQWNTRWDSDNPDFRNRYPDLVEVTLEVKGPSRLVFEGTYLFRPELPLGGLDATL